MNLRRNLPIAILFLTAACGNMVDENGNHNILTPSPLFIRNLPQGNDDYSQGFRDGCNDYIGIAGFGAQRMMDVSTFPTALFTADADMKYRYDPVKAIYNQQYSFGFGHGANYCGIAANAAVGY